MKTLFVVFLAVLVPLFGLIILVFLCVWCYRRLKKREIEQLGTELTEKERGQKQQRETHTKLSDRGSSGKRVGKGNLSLIHI